MVITTGNNGNLEPGSVVPAIVQAVKPFGLFLMCEGQSLLVHLPELTWVIPFDPTKHYSPGDCCNVAILDLAQRVQAASIRKLFANEAAFLRKLNVGDCVETGIAAADASGCGAEIERSFFVDFSRDIVAGFDYRELSRGDRVLLRVEQILPSQNVRFALIGKKHDTAIAGRVASPAR
jgi:hypothetical protein